MTAAARIEDAKPFSVPQLAERWGCSDGLIYKLIRSNRLHSFRLPPENASPACIWRFSVALRRRCLAFRALCCRAVHGARFISGLQPLSMMGAA